MMKESQHETRFAVAGMPRRAGGISPIRQCSAPCSFRSTLHAGATRARIPQEGRRQSESARAETEGQAFRFPRPCRLEDFCFSGLAGEFRRGFPRTGDPLDAHSETLRIVHLPIVVAERLFINVAEQVERFHADIGSLQAAFQETPEVLHAVSVDLPIHVSLSVINDRMGVFVQTVIGQKLVSVDSRARFHMLAHVLLNSLLASVRNDGSADLAVTLKNSGDDGLAEIVKLARLVPLSLMHVSGLTADHGFVGFDFLTRATHLATILALLSKSDPMEHEPRRLLGNVQGPGNLATGNTVLAVVDKPHSRKPFIQTDGAVLEGGNDLDGELASRMPHAALPAQLILEEAYRSAATSRADHAVFPLGATSYEVVKAVLGIREVKDCFLKALWFVAAFHTSILPQKFVLRKYIFTRICSHNPKVESSNPFPATSLAHSMDRKFHRLCLRDLVSGASSQLLSDHAVPPHHRASHEHGRRRESEESPDKLDRLVADCLLYTSDAADDLLCVDLGGR